MREAEAPSYFNPIEATALVDLVEGLINQHRQAAGRPAVTPNDIGVIATYRKQASAGSAKWILGHLVPNPGFREIAFILLWLSPSMISEIKTHN